MENNLDPRNYNVGGSDYAQHDPQPYDIWEDWSLDPWMADITKRVLRSKEGDSKLLDAQKIEHIALCEIDRYSRGKQVGRMTISVSPKYTPEQIIDEYHLVTEAGMIISVIYKISHGLITYEAGYNSIVCLAQILKERYSE